MRNKSDHMDVTIFSVTLIGRENVGYLHSPYSEPTGRFLEVREVLKNKLNHPPGP